MKRFLKISFCIIMAVLMCIPMMACNKDGEGSSKSGLDIRKANGAYIVKSYAKEVVEGEVVDTLVISGKTVVGNEYAGEEIRIAANAFSGNNTLKEIVITSDITEIGKGAFAGMTKLEKLTIPFAGSKVGAVDNARLMGYLFSESSYDEGISITQTVSGSEANSDATKATYYVPATLKTVEIVCADNYVVPEKTFSGFDSALKTVILSGNVAEIGDGAFMGSSIQSIVIPNSVKKIGAYAFASCPMLKDVTLSTGIEYIGEKAFYQFKGTEIAFPEVSENVLVIGTLAFAESKLTEIVGYEYVKETGKWAFYKSEGLNVIDNKLCDTNDNPINPTADKFGNAFDSCK